MLGGIGYVPSLSLADRRARFRRSSWDAPLLRSAWDVALSHALDVLHDRAFSELHSVAKNAVLHLLATPVDGAGLTEDAVAPLLTNLRLLLRADAPASVLRHVAEFVGPFPFLFVKISGQSHIRKGRYGELLRIPGSEEWIYNLRRH
jgi:hypothetical protein